MTRKTAREIAARTKPRFIEIKPEPRRKSSGRFIAIRESVALMGFGEKLLGRPVVSHHVARAG